MFGRISMRRMRAVEEPIARAVDETAEIIAAELVGAEDVGPASPRVPDRRDQAL